MAGEEWFDDWGDSVMSLLYTLTQRNGDESSSEEERITQLVQGKMDLLDEMKWAALTETSVNDTEEKVRMSTKYVRVIGVTHYWPNGTNFICYHTPI